MPNNTRSTTNQSDTLQGIQFPQQAHHKPSTSAFAKKVLAQALSTIDDYDAKKILTEKNWRKKYAQYFKKIVQHSITSPQQCLTIAQQGLTSALQQFEFWRDGKKQSLIDAMAQNQQQPFQTEIITGQGEQGIAPWGIPYKGEFLTGEALTQQIMEWQQHGIIESESADALRCLQQHPEWFDLSAQNLVLFGAASEAGPLSWLAKWKANIIAIDLPNKKVWKKIIQTIQQGNATLIAPAMLNAQGEKCLGADLLTQTPEIANWLASLNQDLALAAIAYLDGEKHVRVSMAMIAIMQKLSQINPAHRIMFMLTPTDIYAVPQQILQRIFLRWQQRHSFEKISTACLAKLPFSRWFQPYDQHLHLAENGKYYGIIDNIVIEQGPNYALAKRLQQWYALLAQNNGQQVSINIAPSTTTQSVIKNPLLKAAFTGAELFAIEAFEPATTNAIMAGLWVYDLHSKADDKIKSDYPIDLLVKKANHGGLWYVPYLTRSALPLVAVYGFLRGSKHKK